jgi:hypothetical protein
MNCKRQQVNGTRQPMALTVPTHVENEAESASWRLDALGLTRNQARRTSHGRLLSTKDADSVAQLLAYNAKREAYLRAIDLNQNGQIDNADRVTDTIQDIVTNSPTPNHDPILLDGILLAQTPAPSKSPSSPPRPSPHLPYPSRRIPRFHSTLAFPLCNSWDATAPRRPHRSPAASSRLLNRPSCSSRRPPPFSPNAAATTTSLSSKNNSRPPLLTPARPLTTPSNSSPRHHLLFPDDH